MTETANPRLCARCGRAFRKAGRIVEGKAVCPSCAPRFNPVERCQRCGRDARIFGYDKGTGERVCRSCLNRETHVTCKTCRKHRRRSEADPTLCRRCAATPGLAHRCPACGARVAGGGSSRCASCAIRRRFDRARESLSAGFATPMGRAVFLGFCAWPGFDATQPDVARELERVAAQIAELEALPGGVGAITQESLMEAFGVDRLRRRQRLIGYLTARRGLEWSDAALDAWNERRRIRDLIEEARDAGHADMIETYAKAMSSRLADRTRRMYLRAALAFLIAQKGRSAAEIDDSRVDAFLRQKPGQRASLTPFVGFLRNQCGAPADRPRSRRAGSLLTADRRLTKRAHALRAALNADPSHAAGRALLIALLATLYRTPIAAVAGLDASAFRLVKGRLWLMSRYGDFRLTPEMAGHVERFARVGGPGPAFPGRPATRPLRADGVRYHIDKLGLETGPRRRPA